MVSENKFTIKILQCSFAARFSFSFCWWVKACIFINILYMYINSYIPFEFQYMFECSRMPMMKHVDYASWDMKSATPLHFIYKWLVWLHTFTTLLAGIDLVWPDDWMCWAMKAMQKLHALSIFIDHCFLGLNEWC